MNPPPNASPLATPLPLPATGRKELAAQAQLQAILQGRYREGDRLTEQALAAEFGISRTPVREALLELEGLGVVLLKRNCGAAVTRFGEVKLREIYAVRRLLEVEATRKAAGRIDPQVVSDLITSCETLLQGSQTDPEWQLDEAIHRAIADACGNRRLAHEIERYATLVRAVRATVGERMPVQELTIREHLAILQPLRDNAPELAAEAMRQHLCQAEESAVRAIAS